MAAVDIRDNLLGISWVDSSWIPILNNGSVLDYFSERSNPFYDRTCNNEVVKMQRMTLEHLNSPSATPSASGMLESYLKTPQYDRECASRAGSSSPDGWSGVHPSSCSRAHSLHYPKAAKAITNTRQVSKLQKTQVLDELGPVSKNVQAECVSTDGGTGTKVSTVIPLADYYIIAGVIYQAPDLGSVINSRVLTAVHGIQSAFEEAMSYCRYHPSKGYWWHFKDQEEREKAKPKAKKKEEPSSIFQRQRVDALLLDLRQKFPPRFVQQKPGEKPIPVDQIKKEPEPAPEAVKPEEKETVKNAQQSTGTKGPPEKRMRLQ